MRTRKPANISTTGRTMVSERACASVSSCGEVAEADAGGLGGERVADLGAVTGERHRRVELLELADAEPVAELAEQLPRRFAPGLGCRQRRRAGDGTPGPRPTAAASNIAVSTPAPPAIRIVTSSR